MKYSFNEVQEVIGTIKPIEDKVEENSREMDAVVDNIIQPYIKDLDKYILFIKDILADGQNPPTDAELDDFVMNLSTYIYFASGMCEQLGIRDDIAEAIYKEVYHSSRSNIEAGTVADKNS